MTAARGLGGVGVWCAGLRWGDRTEAVEAAAELEDLGFSALWIPDTGGDVFGALDRLLAATRSIPAATGVLNLWRHSASDTAAGYADLTRRYGDRLVLGIGVSHAQIVDAGGTTIYEKPMESMRGYLDALDAEPDPVPPPGRVLAALGPRMLELARERAGGAHPYNVTPDHTALARQVLGPDAALLPEMAAVLKTDPGEARAVGRRYIAGYLDFPNYVNNWRRLGFDEADFTGGGSNRLVDSVIAWGDEDAIAQRLQAYFDAGADHVAVQIIGDPGALPRETWRLIAPALTGLGRHR